MKVIVVAGTQAGSGKTTVAVGLMAALRQRGLRVQAFKVGPDPLDPLLHEAATGRPSYTLDGWMLSREYNLTRVARVADSADIAVVEGGETLFDGPDGDERGSAAHVAKTLGAPVLLVLDCAAHSARSAAAVLKGSLALDEELAVAGVVLNKTKSRAHEESFRATLAGPSPKTALRGVPILGAIRRDDAHAGALRDGGFGGRGPSGFAAAAAKAALALRAGGARSVGGGRSADGGQKNPREQQSESFVAGVAAQLARVVGDGVDLNALVDAAWEFVVDETGPAAAAEADRGDANANANASDHPAGSGPDAGDASGAGAGAPPHASSTPSTPSKQDSFGGKDLGAFPAIPESPQSREKGGKPPTSADHPGSQSRKNSIGRHLVTSVASKIGNHLPRPLLFPGVSRGDAPVRVAVALDAAFCHYYRENLALLEAAGAHLVTFSPIAGDSIPESCKGVYFGGGYQELYASELSANRPLRAATAAFASHGGVTYAECGAVAFLSRALADGGATPRPMCGLAPFDTRVVLSEAGSGSSVGSSSFSAAAGAARSGYVEAAVLEGCPIFPAGGAVPGVRAPQLGGGRRAGPRRGTQGRAGRGEGEGVEPGRVRVVRRVRREEGRVRVRRRRGAFFGAFGAFRTGESLESLGGSLGGGSRSVSGSVRARVRVEERGGLVRAAPLRRRARVRAGVRGRVPRRPERGGGGGAQGGDRREETPAARGPGPGVRAQPPAPLPVHRRERRRVERVPDPARGVRREPREPREPRAVVGSLDDSRIGRADPGAPPRAERGVSGVFFFAVVSVSRDRRGRARAARRRARRGVSLAHEQE